MLILLTGGSACGKSSFAEKLCLSLPTPRYYLAAMKPFGPGSAEKIAAHRKMRDGKGFETVERYTDYASLTLARRGTVLLECICNLTANEMFDECGRQSDPYEAVISGVRHVAAQCGDLIVVTNEVGAEPAQYDAGTQTYVQALGRINRALAQMADCVCEMVCGIPIIHKGQLPEEVTS